MFDYADSEGLSYRDTLSKIKQNINKVRSGQMKKYLNRFDPNKQVADVFGLDQDPLGYDPFEEDSV